MILVVSDKEKDTSSTSGMETSRLTSLLLAHRASAIVQSRLEEIERAYLARDFETFGRITMQDSNQFHAVCLDTYPPIFYMNGTSKMIIRLVHALNNVLGGVKAAYTFDAGPNAVIYTTEKYEKLVFAVMAHYFPSHTGSGMDYCNKPAEYDEVVANIDSYLKNECCTSVELLSKLDMTGRSPNPGDVKFIFLTKSGPGPILQSQEESLLNPANGMPVEPGPKHKRMKLAN